MELVGRMLISDSKLYRVVGMDVSGILSCIALNDLFESNKVVHRLDPLTSVVKDTGLNLVDVEEFSIEELSFLTEIDRYLNMEEVVRIVGYRSEFSRYLFVVYCKGNVIHMLDIGQNGVYGLILNNGRVFIPEDLFDRFNIKENVTGHYPKVSWTKSARFFKMLYTVTPNLVETLGRLFHGIECYRKVDLPLLMGNGGTENGKCVVCFKVDGEDGYIMDTEERVLSSLSYREIGLNLLSEYMETYYDYPCIRLSEEELEKVQGMLEAYGYGSVYERLREFNGIQSNFEIKENEEYVCIRDYGNERIYSLHVLRLNAVVSANGIPLYYEIRMYPLCGSDSYVVVYSSRSRKNCESMLHLRYGNLIRGRLVKLKKFPYEVTSVVDTDTTISIRYTLRGSKKVCEGVYNKKFMRWDYKSCFDSTKQSDSDYLEAILRVFDKVADVRRYMPEKYSVYRVVGNRFCLERHFCIGSSDKFQGSRNIIYGANGDKFLIVKWRDDVNEAMWMFSKKDKSMIKIS